MRVQSWYLPVIEGSALACTAITTAAAADGFGASARKTSGQVPAWLSSLFARKQPKKLKKRPNLKQRLDAVRTAPEPDVTFTVTLPADVYRALAAFASGDVSAWAAQLLAEARRNADGIVSAARSDADRFREEMKQQATVQAAGIVERAEREIQRETARAVAQIRQEAVDLSFAIASKVLQRTVTPADHERLLDEVIGKLDRPS